MGKRKVALVLSIIYCGLGQLYKGEILKGIDLIALCTALIMSLVFFSPYLPILRIIGISVVILLWLIGILDVYVSDRDFARQGQFLTMQWLRAVLSVAAISSAVVMITLVVLWPQLFPTKNAQAVAHAGATAVSSIQPPLSSQPESNTAELTEADIGVDAGSEVPTGEEIIEQKPADAPDMQTHQGKQSESPLPARESEKATASKPYFALQVGAFSDKSRADDLASKLSQKKYHVDITPPAPGENPKLYKVRLGRFESRDEAQKAAERMLKNGEIDIGIVVNVP